MEARLRRTLADLDNLRKRCRPAKSPGSGRPSGPRWRRGGCPSWTTWTAPWSTPGRTADALVDGVRAVRDQAVGILAQLGFPRYEDVGRPFDPARHEASAPSTADAPPGTVVAVIRPGYGTRREHSPARRSWSSPGPARTD